MNPVYIVSNVGTAFEAMRSVGMEISWKSLFLLIAWLICIFPESINSLGEIIFAVNCGGDSHTDVYGVFYHKDPLKIGTASDFGKQLIISRVPPVDQILYQTERYHHATFGYDIPIKQEGDYVLVLKFSEVYFTSPNQKVFSVVLNNAHTVITDLDIFDKVGRGAAYDEYIPFTVVNNKIQVQGEESKFHGKLRVDFVKGYRDNPKINAMFVMKGSVDEVPKLPPLPTEQEEEYFREETMEERKPTKNRRPSGPRTPDPYALDDSSIMLPVFVAIGAFIPLLFCLCKL